jgi:hypothetical protein
MEELRKRLSEIKSEAENQKIVNDRLAEIAHKSEINKSLRDEYLKSARPKEELEKIVRLRVDELIVRNRLQEIEDAKS